MGLLNTKMGRRAFIKKGAIAGLGLGLAYYTLEGAGLTNLIKKQKEGKIWKHAKEAYYYTTFGDYVQCQLCPNRCKLKDGERSWCRVREPKNGKLYTLAYANPCAVHVDPIEKKPLFHFLPTTTAYSLATAGCNFRCLNCQNWQISQFPPQETSNYNIPPQKVIHNAKANNTESIAYTYSEPIIFYEYMLDTSKLAHQAGINNVMITNGHINQAPLKELCNHIDAANVDIKSFDQSIYEKLNKGHLQPVLDTIKTMRNNDVWVEITNLIIPGYTDDLNMIKNMCTWIKNNPGPHTPLHLSRFSPMYKLRGLPATPVSTLKKARKIAFDMGLHYVYIGNVPDIGEDTICPNCNKIVIKRRGYSVLENNLEDGKCKFCGQEIGGIWHT